MSIISGLLNQTATSISSYTKDVYGDKTYTVVYSDVSCRWQEILEEEILGTGKVITYTIKMFLMPSVKVKRGYKVIRDGANFTVRKINTLCDLDGEVDHFEVYLN